MKVLCINDANKPAKISQENWVKEGKIYTVIEVKKMGLQKGQLGYKLEEISIPEKSFPYEYYDSSRFIPIEGLFMTAKKELEKSEKKEKIKEEEFDLDLI